MSFSGNGTGGLRSRGNYWGGGGTEAGGNRKLHLVLAGTNDALLDPLLAVAEERTQNRPDGYRVSPFCGTRRLTGMATMCGAMDTKSDAPVLILAPEVSVKSGSPQYDIEMNAVTLAVVAKIPCVLVVDHMHDLPQFPYLVRKGPSLKVLFVTVKLGPPQSMKVAHLELARSVIPDLTYDCVRLYDGTPDGARSVIKRIASMPLHTS